MRDTDSPLSFLFVSILFALSSLLFPRMVSPALAAQTTQDVTIDLSSYTAPTTVTISSNVGTLTVVGATDLAINIVIEGNTTNVYHTASGANSSITIKGNLQGEAILDGPLGSFSVLGNGTGGGLIRVNQPLGSLSISGNSNLTVDLVSTVGEVNIVGNVNGGMNVDDPGDVGTIVIQGNLNSPIVIADGVTVDNLFITGNVNGGGSVVVADGGTLNNLMVVGSVNGSTDVPAQQGDMACVSNNQPLASVSVSPAEPVPGSTVTLDASASTDSEDGSPASYTWQVTSAPEPVALAPNAASPTVSFVPGSTGDYALHLTVRDSCGFVDVVGVAVHVAWTYVTYTAIEVGTPFETGGTHLSMYGSRVAVGGWTSPTHGYYDTSSGQFVDLLSVMGRPMDDPVVWGTRIVDSDRFFDVSSGELFMLPMSGAADVWSDRISFPAYFSESTVSVYDASTGAITDTPHAGWAVKICGDWVVFTTPDFHIAVYSLATGQLTILPNQGITTDGWSDNRRYLWGDQAVFLGLDEYFGQVDLNGDGKLTVLVSHLDLTTMTVQHVAVGTPLGIYENKIVFFNDLASLWGDVPDYTLKVYDLNTGTTTDLGFQGGTAALWGDVIAYTALESWIGEDRTGDGDLEDWVLGYARFALPAN